MSFPQVSTQPARAAVPGPRPGTGAAGRAGTSVEEALGPGTASRVLDHRGGVLVVLGAPGTGRSWLAVEHVRRRILGEGLDPDRCLLVAPTRQAAARLRTGVGAGLGVTHTEPLARTPSSLAFAILRMGAAAAGEPMPRLLSGAEQDVILRELLAGHAAEGSGPDWPEHLRPALGTAGFRAQLRDLLMRAVEHGLEAADLARLADEHDRPEWAAAAQVLEEYDQVTALAEPGGYDPAWICTAAADLLEEDEVLLERVRGRLSVVVVDDAHELTASAARLLSVIHRPGSDLLLLGDPDSTVLGFRGAVPGRFLELARELHGQQPTVPTSSSPALPGLELGDLGAQPTGRGGRGRATGEVPTVVLRRRLRGGPELTEVMDRVVDRVGTSVGVAHRHPDPAGGRSEQGDELTVLAGTARSQAQEAAYVSQWLRHAHLRDGVPWSRMAVVARSGRQHEVLRRALGAGGVPTRVERSGLPLGQDPAVAPLLLAYDVVTREPVLTEEGTAGEDPTAWWLDPDEAVALLTSSLAAVDPVQLRRLRRRARAAELAGGGARPADEVLAERIVDPELRRTPAAMVDPTWQPLARLGRVLDAGRAAALGSRDGEGSAEEVLWALWSASGLAEQWGRQALSGGATGARADRDLDSVLVLFGAAAAFVERLPGAGPRRFLEHVRSAEVAADTLVAGGHLPQAVELVTPAAAAGRHWDLVAVVGVQDGVWPDLRLRDTLLGAEALVAALRGGASSGPEAVRAAQSQVRSDELRQFHVAVSRADRRLLVTAVASVDDQPSVLLDLVDPTARSRPPLEVPPTMTLRGMVGRLRRVAVQAHRDGDHEARDRALDSLLRLGREGVGGADPELWWDARVVSDADRPMVPEGPVRVSPSQVQTFQDCPLRWLLQGRGGQDSGGMLGAQLGTLVHDIAAQDPHAPVERLHSELDRRWPELGLPQGWIADRQRLEAQAMLERYADYARAAAAEGRSLVGTEVRLRVAVPVPEASTGREVLVTGSVDRLEVDAEGRGVVVDLKTGSQKVPKAELVHHAQLGAYQVAVDAGAFAEVEGRPGPTTTGGALLVQLRKGGTQEQKALGEDPDPSWAHDMLLAAGEGMAGASFPAVENKGCRTCAARFCCPVQPEGAER